MKALYDSKVIQNNQTKIESKSIAGNLFIHIGIGIIGATISEAYRSIIVFQSSLQIYFAMDRMGANKNS